jgi:two-component system, OmpR family, phosphate regulon response regulator PhoB
VGSLGRILVVEDDAELRRIWQLTLTLEGFDVEVAGDGQEALYRLEDRRPDLVVLDLGLPVLSGIVVRQEIAARALTRDIPVVVVTGSVADPASLDVDCVIHKPVTPEALIRVVRQCLHIGTPGVGI